MGILYSSEDYRIVILMNTNFYENNQQDALYG
jgi:GH25 family lysozyme M1 (1,4-beta-N-acetylmuramidase)